MAVFTGIESASRAVRAALVINHVVADIVVPKLDKELPALRAGGYQLHFATGVDFGSVLVVRAGPMRANDLLWVGKAANVAAKLSAIRDLNCTTYITPAVLSRLAADVLHFASGQAMWAPLSWNSQQIFGTNVRMLINGSPT